MLWHMRVTMPCNIFVKVQKTPSVFRTSNDCCIGVRLRVCSDQSPITQHIVLETRHMHGHSPKLSRPQAPNALWSVKTISTLTEAGSAAQITTAVVCADNCWRLAQVLLFQHNLDECVHKAIANPAIPQTSSNLLIAAAMRFKATCTPTDGV